MRIGLYPSAGKGLFAAMALVGALLAGCHTNTYEEPKPGVSTATQEVYPLDKAYEEGIAGTFTLVKQADGTALGKLALTGLKPGYRYFANMSRGSAAQLSETDVFADLRELGADGKSETWLHEDYLNQPLIYDSLLKVNAMVRIQELAPGKAGYTDVLRGNIGSNLLLPEIRTYALAAYNNSGVSGTISLQVRRNGNYLATTTLQGLARNAFAPVRLWAGRPEQITPTTQPLVKLNPVDASTGVSESEVPGLPGGLAALDTLNGYFGVGTSQGRPTVLLAVGPLRK